MKESVAQSCSNGGALRNEHNQNRKYSCKREKVETKKATSQREYTSYRLAKKMIREERI